MTPTPTDTPSAGAMRAAEAIYQYAKDGPEPKTDDECMRVVGEIIDRESGLGELATAAEGVAASLTMMLPYLEGQWHKITTSNRDALRSALSHAKGGE